MNGIKILSMIELFNFQGNNSIILIMLIFRPPSPKGALSKFLSSTVSDVIKR